MFQPSKIGNLLAALGAVGGAFYAVKNQKSITILAAITIGFGLGGYIVGNSVSKFLEPSY